MPFPPPPLGVAGERASSVAPGEPPSEGRGGGGPAPARLGAPGNARAEAVELAWAAHTVHTEEECPYEEQIEELRQNDVEDEAAGDE